MHRRIHFQPNYLVLFQPLTYMRIENVYIELHGTTTLIKEDGNAPNVCTLVVAVKSSIKTYIDIIMALHKEEADNPSLRLDVLP